MMGSLLAVMIFLFPLGMPVVTLVGVGKVSLSKHPLATRVLRSIFLAPVLMLAQGPAIERNGSGAFALPWWLVGADAERYVWQYGLLVLCSSVLLSLVTEAVRAALERGRG